MDNEAIMSDEMIDSVVSTMSKLMEVSMETRIRQYALVFAREELKEYIESIRDQNLWVEECSWKKTQKERDEQKEKLSLRACVSFLRNAVRKHVQQMTKEVEQMQKVSKPMNYTVEKVGEEKRVVAAPREIKERMVRVYNCEFVITLGDGEQIAERIATRGGANIFKIKEFEKMINEGRIQGCFNNGVVVGYTDLAEDVELEDFNTAIDMGGDKTLEIDHGRGIVERIKRQQFLSVATRGSGNQEQLAYVNNAEIKYGQAQDGYDYERNDQLNEMIDRGYETKQLDEGSNYDIRSREEMRYHADKIKTILSKPAKSWGDLYKSVQGILFPTDLIIMRCDPNDKSKRIHDRVIKKWFLPVNAMSKEDRKLLLAMYHAQAEKFKQFRGEGEAILVQIVEMRKQGLDTIAELQKIDRETALKILAAARDRMKRGVEALSKEEYPVVLRISKYVTKERISPEMESIIKNVAERFAAVLGDKEQTMTMVKSLTKSDAYALMEHARRKTAAQGKNFLEIDVWRIVNEKTKH